MHPTHFIARFASSDAAWQCVPIHGLHLDDFLSNLFTLFDQEYAHIVNEFYLSQNRVVLHRVQYNTVQPNSQLEQWGLSLILCTTSFAH